MIRAGVAALVALLSTRAAGAQPRVPLRWTGPDGCPAPSAVQSMLDAELSRAAEVHPGRFVATARRRPDGRWALRLLDGDGRALASQVLSARSCEQVARLATQQVVFRVAVMSAPREATSVTPVVPLPTRETPPPREAPIPPDVPAVAPEPPREAPAEPAPPSSPPPGSWPRYVIDLGGGVGAALVSGRALYAERFDYTVEDRPEFACPGMVCPSPIDATVGATYWLTFAIRHNITRRIGVSIGVRFQLDAAEWTTSATIQSGNNEPVTLSQNNAFSNLLLMGRVYFALTDNGFAWRGWSLSAFAGGGAGQIEPRPAVSGATLPGAHVFSGYGNAHAGLRVEYGLSDGVHVAAEVAAHVMFPVTLFDLDTALLVGLHR